MKRLLLITTLLSTVYTADAQRYRGFGDDYTKWRFGLQGGWSYRIAKISPLVPPQLKPHIEGLKSGYHFGADASFFLNRGLGLGIKYSGFRSSNETDGLAGADSAGKATTGSVRDDIMMHYIGPVLNGRYISENGWFQFISSFSIGYLSYTQDEKIVYKYTFVNDEVIMDLAKLTSSTLGMVGGIGADFAVHDNISLGLEVSAMLGTLNYYNVQSKGTIRREELPANQREGVSRIDVSAGVRFNF